MYAKSISAVFAATLFASANAHFFISAPVPIPGSAPKDPLDASGDNFPCHGADLTQGQTTSMAVGSTQPLQFDLGQGANTAVHGGGSCQISLTYETDATKLKDPASWKVIHSFIGGCPTNAMGNLDTAVACPASAPNCVNQNFTFQIPQEVQNGDAILAWTWFNNIGNREIYMNCAKVSISGGSNKLDSLPAMAVANLAGINSCSTTEEFNTDYPDPGQYVTKDSTLNYPTKLLQGSGCGTGQGSANIPSSGGSSGSSASGSASTATPASGGQNTPASGGQNTPAAVSTNTGGVFAPGAASPTATHVATTFVTSPASAAATGSTGGSTGSTGATGACTNGQVACTASGFYCISSTTFGMCAFGCATPMQVAGGTQCGAGAIEAIVVPSKEKKRSHPRHLHALAHQARHVSPLL